MSADMKTIIVLLAIACGGYWYTEIRPKQAQPTEEEASAEVAATPAPIARATPAPAQPAAVPVQPKPVVQYVYVPAPRPYVAPATPYPTPQAAQQPDAPRQWQPQGTMLNRPPSRVKFGHH